MPSSRTVALFSVLTVGTLAVAALIFSATERAAGIESNEGRAVEMADLRSQLLDLSLEALRLDALSMRDVLSEEPLYGIPDETEAPLREKLQAFGDRVEAFGADGEQLDEIRTSVDTLLTSARQQLALKTTEPREIAQHEEVARESLTHQQELVRQLRNMDDRLEAAQMQAVRAVSDEAAVLVRLMLGSIGVALATMIASFLLLAREGPGVRQERAHE